MANKDKEPKNEVAEVVLQNVTLDEPQTFDLAWAESILNEQARYDGFKPYKLPEDSPFEYNNGKLTKK